MHWQETLVLGRRGEPTGSMHQRLRIDRSGRALLRSDLCVGPQWPGSCSSAVLPAGTRAVACAIDVAVGAPTQALEPAAETTIDGSWASNPIGPGATMWTACSAFVSALPGLYARRAAADLRAADDSI